MIEVQKIVKKTCDLCKRQTEKFTREEGGTESHPFTIQLIFNVWYGGEYRPDICYDCNKKLLDFLAVYFKGFDNGERGSFKFTPDK